VDDLSRLYRETVLRHAQDPVGFCKDIRVTHHREQFNPLCGDRILLMLEINGQEIKDAAFEGDSCAICKASASMLCESAPGQAVESIRKLHQWLEEALHGNEGPASHESLRPLLGVHRYPSRIRCALLPWDALAGAVDPGRPG
jgi:nitrogen fixation NifU-like protein